jgi:hypothetical protein
MDEIDPYLNASLIHYTKDMPLNPYLNLMKLHPYPMTFFRLMEAFQVIDPPGKEGVGLGIGATVLSLRGLPVSTEGDLLISDLGFHETLLACKARLKLGGSVLVVVPDQTKLSDVQLTYLFAACFTTVQIMLPSMSHADADRVLYCTDFLGNVPSWAVYAPPYNFTMTSYFITKLDEINSIFGQARFDQVRAGSKDKCAEWVRKFM